MTTEENTQENTEQSLEEVLNAEMDKLEAAETDTTNDTATVNDEATDADESGADVLAGTDAKADADEDAPADKANSDDKSSDAAEGAQDTDDAQDVAPSSWRREIADKWSELPAEVKAEINRREADYHKGIEQYKQAAQFAQDMQQTIAPHMDMIHAAGVTPTQAIEHLMGYHRTLTYGTAEQKREAIARIARDCQIDLKDLAPAAPIPQEVQELRAQNQQLQQFQQQTMQSQQQAMQAEIQEFARNNEHFEAVKQDMSTMLQTGMAQTLQEAYDKAVWARPDLRKSLVEAQRTEAEKRATEQAQRKRAKSAAVGVKGSGPSSTGALPENASVEETIAAAMDGLIS